jgi:hypothetical protein
VDTAETIAGTQWEFRCDEARLWRWRCRAADGVTLSSSPWSFSSLLAALEDARRNGFSYAAASKKQV